MRTVLVCVRTPVAARTIATSAARLGMATAVRTALTAGEALAHLAVEPAELVLADTALSRPDSAAFIRSVLAAAPAAWLVPAVLRGMANGKGNAEIGRELLVSEHTVKTHARRLFRKLGARDRAHAVASAFRASLVS